MYQPLVPCEACSRHIRDVEARCPFCATARVARPSVMMIEGPMRVSRAGAMALVAVAAIAVAGCHDDSKPTTISADPTAKPAPSPSPNASSTEPTPTPTVAHTDAGLVDDHGAMATKYGGPPHFSPKPVPSPTAPSPVAVPAYGGAPPPMPAPPPAPPKTS